MRRTQSGILYLCWLAAVAIAACQSKQEVPVMFSALGADSTGLHFLNKLTPTADFNLFSYMYYYNGAGVGAADFNNDGHTDLFFAANQQAPALYLGDGALHFSDITQKSGIGYDGGWNTGVSVADVNADGLLDIYLCRVSGYKGLQGNNQLWLCTGIKDGIPQYQEKAAAFGLNFAGFSTQAAFFDYDLDGDLDMFLLNHSVNHDGNYAPRENFLGTYDSLAGHRFYRNDGAFSADSAFTPTYTDITRNSGINSSAIGYGLGVVVSDINFDGWPDIYVGNDFHENDYLYINQHNGTFSEEGTQRLQHTSQFSMGVDAGDIDNDGLTDIVSMDMLPYNDTMLRRSVAEDAYDIFQHKLAYGYHYQYARNNLQRNMGNGHFAEIGQYAGIEATDWSWAALLFDFDNDGYRDLFVSNGIPKRMNDIDYINYVAGEELQRKLQTNTLQDKDLGLISKFPEIKLPNQFFSNKGKWAFARLGNEIANNQPGFSNGAAYADFDNDGDLDLVVNNINDAPLLYRNHNYAPANSNFASVSLEYKSVNSHGIGTKIICWTDSSVQLHEAFPVRGFLSSMQGNLHLGLGKNKPDSCLVIWPDNSGQWVDVQKGKKQTISYKPSIARVDYNSLVASIHKPTAAPSVQDITDATGINFTHLENPFNEFAREALMPYMVSTEGPALAVADINGDGLDDLFVGGSKTNKGKTWVQHKDGSFMELPQAALAADSMWEHVDAKWADMNGDGKPDLIIATGGNEYYGTDDHLQPLLYLNDGSGVLTRKKDAFPAIYTTQSKLLVHDFNADGMPDLFVAGRAVPWQYGLSPRSFLLQNDGGASFKDITPAELQKPGMVTDAALADMDADGHPDLVMCMDWGAVQVTYHQKKGWSKPQAISTGSGWWQTISIADINDDGLPDIFAGNYGLNNRLRPSAEKPVKLYANDFDDNGRIEQVMTYQPGAVEIPFAGKMQLEKQLPGLKKKYLYAEQFSSATLNEVFGKEKLKNSVTLQATEYHHILLTNKGKGQFSQEYMPELAQLSTVRCIQYVAQAGGKGWLLHGNFSGYHVELGRQDANFGLWLHKQGEQLIASPLAGATVAGEVRKAMPIIINGVPAIVLAKNNAPLQIIRLQP